MTDPMFPDLFPHQEAGADRIAKSVPTYLGMDMGIGKTRTFIEAASRRCAERVLVICPASAVLVWKREIDLWDQYSDFVVVRNRGDLRNTDATYFIVSHGLMSQKNSPVVEALAHGLPFDMTAIDEAHGFNAADTNRVKALRRVSHKLGQIVPLSGTPMRNHAGDLYTLMSICWPKGLKQRSGHVMTRTEFEDAFCRVNYRAFGNRGLTRVIEGSKNLGQLKTLMAPFMLRVRKEDVLKDLPPIIWDAVPVALDTAHMPPLAVDQLDKIMSAFMAAATLENATPDDITQALSVMGNSMALSSLRHLLGLAKLRGATEYVIDLLENLPHDRKVLVFAHHAHVIKALSRHFGEYLPAVLTGSSTAAERAAAVDQFLTNPQCRVFIGNIQAAGTAITLVGPTCKCSDVVFVESSWTPMDNAQAACRVHRIGQKDGVVVRMLSAAGTADDIVNGLLVRKAREFTQLFDSQQGAKT